MENANTTDCLANWLTRVHLKLKTSINKKLKTYNLTVEQRAILLLLYENSSMSQSEICKQTLSEASNITVTLKRMGENGYIIKSHHPTDKRTTLISLSKKACDLEKKLKQIGKDNLNELLYGISEDERDTTIDVLKKIYKNILYQEIEKLV